MRHYDSAAKRCLSQGTHFDTQTNASPYAKKAKLTSARPSIVRCNREVHLNTKLGNQVHKEQTPDTVLPPGRCGYRGIYNRYFKRGIDFVLALLLAVPVTPVILLLCIIIAAEDGFPAFYTPLRGGYRGKPFRIFKLRTMRKNADRFGGTTALNDPRITRSGRILRKLKLDELPQIYNVLIGTMSFIGPRPELLQYTDAYRGEEKLILEVRPGITDFSSIEFISLDEIVGSEHADEMYEKYVLQKKNRLRIRYAREVSLRTDFILFFKTIGCVLRKAWHVIFKKTGGE